MMSRLPTFARLRRATLLAFTAASVIRVTPAFALEIVAPGEPVTLVATADGHPAPSFIWYRDGVEIHRGVRLVIASFKATDSGVYRVRAENAIGAAESPDYEFRTPDAPPAPVITDVKVQTVEKAAP